MDDAARRRVPDSAPEARLSTMSTLFSPIQLRSLTLKNRVVVSPMCQYSCAEDGLANEWHLVHYGQFALGGSAVVISEAAAVAPEGRISPWDLGIWSDAHAQALERVTAFQRAQGAIPAIQLAHAGRKAGTAAPWLGGKPMSHADGGWTRVAPSARAFDAGYEVPRALDRAAIDGVVDAFAAGARRAAAAGYQIAEVHAAHGYLLHQFLSPLSNARDDEYGGSLDNRMRLPLRVAAAVREVWPRELPIFVRISATDWVDGGWDLAQSVELAKRLKELGVDLVDTSSGGLDPAQKIALGPGYQVPFAAAIRAQAAIATGAVGLVTEAAQAEAIVAEQKADLVLLGRSLLAEPRWPLRAAKALGVEVPWPRQWLRAR
jgi:2,4-dienoyl-CoA reductase-like NADH-dependent reductase (Old Yellow Enzyme family)